MWLMGLMLKFMNGQNAFLLTGFMKFSRKHFKES